MKKTAKKSHKLPRDLDSAFFGKTMVNFSVLTGAVLDDQKMPKIKVADEHAVDEGAGDYVGKIKPSRGVQRQDIKGKAIWIKPTGATEAKMVRLSHARGIKAGQKVSVVTPAAEGFNWAYYSFLYNHDTDKFRFIRHPKQVLVDLGLAKSNLLLKLLWVALSGAVVGQILSHGAINLPQGNGLLSLLGGLGVLIIGQFALRANWGGAQFALTLVASLVAPVVLASKSEFGLTAATLQMHITELAQTQPLFGSLIIVGLLVFIIRSAIETHRNKSKLINHMVDIADYLAPNSK